MFINGVKCEATSRTRAIITQPCDMVTSEHPYSIIYAVHTVTEFNEKITDHTFMMGIKYLALSSAVPIHKIISRITVFPCNTCRIVVALLHMCISNCKPSIFITSSVPLREYLSSSRVKFSFDVCPNHIKILTGCQGKKCRRYLRKYLSIPKIVRILLPLADEQFVDVITHMLYRIG